MPELFFVNEDKKINVEVGGNLRKTAIASEIGVYSNILTKLFNCRGKGICGTCVVKIDSKNITVFHDDLDIDFGKIKAKFGGSSAGHNGIESIDKFIGKEYSRVRIGIGKPNTKSAVTDHVLKDFDEDEKIELEKITNNIIDSISILLDKKLDLFSSTVNNK